MTGTRTLRSDEPLAVELTAALKHGEVDRLRRLLAANPGLALCVVENAKGGGRTPLHLYADWPGHNSNAVDMLRTLAAAGADLDAPAVGIWHRETPLHWAASNDDLALIDALLDAGADIERAGSSIDDGSPLSCAVGYGPGSGAVSSSAVRVRFCGTKRRWDSCRRSGGGSKPTRRRNPKSFQGRCGTHAMAGSSPSLNTCWRTAPI